MRSTSSIPHKIHTLESLQKQVHAWRVSGQSIAFTNGVFDILHEGHIFSLSQAAAEADRLIVAINSDASVKRLKGPERPINPAPSRALLMAALVMVDAVLIFEEDTPLQVVQQLLPDVMVKGGDYQPHQVVGGAEVIARGGRVVINPLIAGLSTTGIIEAIQKQEKPANV